MHKRLILALCILTGFSVKAQTNLDSLYSVWQDTTRSDSIRSQAYGDYIWDGFLFSRPDTAFILAEELISYGLKNNYPKAQAGGYTLQGVSWLYRVNFAKTLYYYTQALEIYKQIDDSGNMAGALNNIGTVYDGQGNHPKALEFYIRSLEINDKIGNQKRSAVVLSNIGDIYLLLGNYPKALEYNRKSLEVSEQLGDQIERANALKSIGVVYMRQDDYQQAIDYFNQALEIFELIDHKLGIASSYYNFGLLYSKQGDYTKALDYYNRSLKINKKIGEKSEVAQTLTDIGVIYRKQGNYQKALNYCQQGFILSSDIGSLRIQKDGCICLYDTYKAMNNSEEALKYLELLGDIEKNLKAEETSNKLQQMEYEKLILEDSIAKANDARLIEEAHQKEVHQKENIRNISLGIGVFFVLVAIGFYYRWHYVRKSKALLQVEKDRSEHLLLNILPQEVAQELKETGKAAPRKYDSVTILFTDFKDFTKLVSTIPATTLIAELNEIFSQFDNIVDEFGLEKIETIGDAYMAAGGLPIQNKDHALNCIEASFRMLEYINHRNESSKIRWNMRVGIHSGAVTAGVVGKKKFAYDLFGDTVNTASRMESNGQAGKVNISQATYDLLKNNPDLNFEYRGKIEAKGKGKIEMYFVSYKEKNQLI